MYELMIMNELNKMMMILMNELIMNELNKTMMILMNELN